MKNLSRAFIFRSTSKRKYSRKKGQIILNEFEIKILDFIRERFACPFLDAVMPLITSLANGGIIWIIAAVLLLIFKKSRKTGFSVALALITGLIIGNLILKNLVGRIRPYEFNEGVEILVARLSDYSFPSGHTLASFEAATALLIRDKRLGVPALVLAVAIAFSRLYLYVHYPTDVLAGIILGVLIGIFACKTVDKLENRLSARKSRQ